MFVLEQAAIFISMVWMVYVSPPVLGSLWTALFVVPLCEIGGIFFMVEYERLMEK